MRMNSFLTMILIAACLTPLGFKNAAAQESGSKPAADVAEPLHAYRLDFMISEMEDGKKINTRQYAMNLNSGEGDELKIGTRVPVEVKQGEIQYLDVGTSIWCRLRDSQNSAPSEHGFRELSWLKNDVMLDLKAELSNFAIPDQQTDRMRPAIRQMKIQSSTIAMLGKQMVVGVVDDPNSKRQFQLEVTVTKLK
jgi:hypothetical protein